jgi:hypothetical protein
MAGGTLTAGPGPVDVAVVGGWVDTSGLPATPLGGVAGTVVAGAGVRAGGVRPVLGGRTEVGWSTLPTPLRPCPPTPDEAVGAGASARTLLAACHTTRGGVRAAVARTRAATAVRGSGGTGQF